MKNHEFCKKSIKIMIFDNFLEIIYIGGGSSKQIC